MYIVFILQCQKRYIICTICDKSFEHVVLKTILKVSVPANFEEFQIFVKMSQGSDNWYDVSNHSDNN
jgi:hypothetical protein